MSKARIYARNLAANWIGYGANLAVMFFMSPFVVHTLGDTRYGVWSLIMSLTGYLGLVELGTRGGLGRYINYYLGKEDVPRVNGTINTAMFMFAGAGVLLTVAAVILAAFFGTFFPKVPDELATTGIVTVGVAAETETAVAVGPVGGSQPITVGAAAETETAGTVAVVSVGVFTGWGIPIG